MSAKEKLWERPMHIRATYYGYFVVICTIFRMTAAEALGDEIGVAETASTTAITTIVFAMVIEIAHRRHSRREPG
jgi:hypothetical protein